MELTRSQKFIRDNARTMRTATEYFNLDTNLMTMEDYEKADLRLLVVFPSPATTKSVSMTASVLNDFVISKCPGVFIDFAFVPEQDDLSTFDKFMMPYAIGNITGLDASHYDLVGFSISILFEAMTTAMIVNSFSRCDRPIPLTWSERKDHKFGETPALYLGGITASVTDVLFGDVGDGRQAFVDFIHLGEFHCVKDFFDHCIDSKKLGRTVQENLDTFWPLSPEYNWLYQPQAYKVTYNDRNQIVSNIKINPNAPDMCQPYYPDEIPHLNGAARGIIQGNGGNAGLGQFMAANGCSRSGFCNFSVAKGTLVASEAGLVRIEELEGCGPIRLQSTGVVTAQNVEKQRRERVYRVVLESGSFLDCSLSHKWVRAVDVGKRERRYTTRQIRNRLKKGEEFVVLRKIGNHLEFDPLHYKVLSLISMSKRIDFRAMQRSCEEVEWTNKGYCYRTGLNYAQNMIEINNWITDFNFAGYDTSVEVTNRGYAVIYFWPVANSVVHDRVMSVIKLNKFSDMYDVVETDDHTVCYNSIITSQCHEGAFSGGWVENTPDRLVELAKIARRYTAATTLKAYSYNSNYLSDYKRSIYDWMSIFPHVTFNNMRLEELGLDPDALKMMKLSGYKRMTAPLEGVSQRVRNNFLNKNLSEKAIDAYLTYGMMMGAVECKIGIVLTGFEEDQDWQEFFDFNEKWQKKAREMGGKIPFRYNMTYLVHYPHTPAEYWERRSVRTALYGGFLMPYKWNKKMTDNKIRIKINGFKHSTLIEQALIDLGRELTSWLYQYLIKPGYPIYSFKPVVNRKEAWEELVSRINIDYFFNERKFDEYISVSHRIHVALHANVILQAMRTLQGGLNAQPTIRCLKTYDGCPVECKANAFARNPLITYGDAWINDKGKLEGVVWEEVKGCQRCKTVEDRKKVLTRTLPKSKTANDILSFKAPALRLRLRFRVERSEPYDVLSPRTTAFTSLSLFLKESQELTDMFWELENNYNMYWQSEKEYFYTVSGQMIYDVTFRDRKAKEIVESLIDKVNAKAKTFRIISVSEVPLTSQIKPTDLNVFYFESTIPAELWQYASMMYKGEVKAEDESGMMATKIDSSLRPPQFTLEDKVKGYFVIPCRYSPWCYLQGLMSSKRVALRKLLKTTKVRCLTTVRETNISCVCGKENAVVDMTTGLYKPLGLDCLVNWFTNKIKK